jgi:hypothetical protein
LALQQAFHHTRLARSQDAKRSWRIRRHSFGQVLKPNSGILFRGTVLSDSSGADAGKLVAATVGNEGQVYGILLDANVDTAQAFIDSSVTGSIARAGSFKGPKKIAELKNK